MTFDWLDETQECKGGPKNVKVPKLEVLTERDPYLRLHEWEIKRRSVKANYKMLFSKNILYLNGVKIKSTRLIIKANFNIEL